MCSALDVELGRRLRRRRRLLGMTQEALGDACGVRFQQIQKYDSAASRISAVMIGRLAHALGISVLYFYEGLEPLMVLPARTRPGPGRGASPPTPD